MKYCRAATFSPAKCTDYLTSVIHLDLLAGLIGVATPNKNGLLSTDLFATLDIKESGYLGHKYFIKLFKKPIPSLNIVTNFIIYGDENSTPGTLIYCTIRKNSFGATRLSGVTNLHRDKEGNLYIEAYAFSAIRIKMMDKYGFNELDFKTKIDGSVIELTKISYGIANDMSPQK